VSQDRVSIFGLLAQHHGAIRQDTPTPITASARSTIGKIMFKTIMTVWGVVIVVGGVAIGTSTLNSRSAPSSPVISAPAVPVHQTPIRLAYNEVARYPERHLGKAVVFTGKVIQVLNEGNSVLMRVVVTWNPRGWWNYEDVVLLRYRDPLKSDGRILENDIVEFRGVFKGTQNYKAIFGQSIDKPSVAACDVLVTTNPRAPRDCT
jgi:hypothetical protein